METSFSDGVLTIIRTFDAPCEKVFDAWVNAHSVEQWYGPGECQGVSATIEPMLGGKYTLMMKMGNGREFDGGGVIIEFDPPNLLAFRGAGPDPEHPSVVRVEFLEEAGKTVVRLTQTNLSQEIAKFAGGGWQSALEKLGSFLDD